MGLETGSSLGLPKAESEQVEARSDRKNAVP